MTFKRDMQKAEKEIEKAAAKAISAASIKLFSAIVMATPVGNPSLWKTKYPPKGYTGGRLRANWNASIGKADSSVTSETDSSGNSTASKGAVLSNFKLSDRAIYLSNNLPYALRVENGWSQQRPKGMVRINTKKFKKYLDITAKGLSK